MATTVGPHGTGTVLKHAHITMGNPQAITAVIVIQLPNFFGRYHQAFTLGLGYRKHRILKKKMMLLHPYLRLMKPNLDQYLYGRIVD